MPVTGALAVLVLVQAVSVLPALREAAVRTDPSSPLLLPLTPEGALVVAGMHSGSAVGLVVAAVLAAVLVAADHESGVWPALRLADPRIVHQYLRALATGCLVTVGVTTVSAVVLFVTAQLARARFPLPAEPLSPGWGAAGETLVRALVVQAFFLALAQMVAVIARNVVVTVAGTVAPVLVTLPLVLTDVVAGLPHYWVAAWMGFPESGQFALYWWSRGPTVLSTGRYGAAVGGLFVLLLLVGLLVVRRRGR